MGSFDFILNQMNFSYSSLSAFHTCPGSFYLSYIQCEDRINNFFSDFGNLVHEVLELFFKGELEIEDMAEYYESHFVDAIKNDAPPYPKGMRESYYESGLAFFKKFLFNKELYDIIFIEDYINAVHRGQKIVVKPDLILREKETGHYFLIDYKTAKIKQSKKDKEKQLEEYKKQFLLYSYFLWIERQIEIKSMKIWFIRDNVEIVIPVDPMEAQQTIEWAEETIKAIKSETVWQYNNTKENKYFCENICGLRNVCPKMK